MTHSRKILVFAGSNSPHSINKRLAVHAATVLQETAGAPLDIEVLDLNDYEMPIYSPAREAAGIPQQALDFFAKIGGADGLILSLAEHNGSYTAAFKNIFDWCSRIEMALFQQKPMLLMATSPGPSGAQHVHGAAKGGFPFFGANIVSTFQFGPFSEHFDDQTERLSSPALIDELQAAVAALNGALGEAAQAA